MFSSHEKNTAPDLTVSPGQHCSAKVCPHGWEGLLERAAVPCKAGFTSPAPGKGEKVFQSEKQAGGQATPPCAPRQRFYAPGVTGSSGFWQAVCCPKE